MLTLSYCQVLPQNKKRNCKTFCFFAANNLLLNSLNVEVGGLVFGISNTEVTPPATAALLPLSKFSASLAPKGSLKMDLGIYHPW